MRYWQLTCFTCRDALRLVIMGQPWPDPTTWINRHADAGHAISCRQL